MARNQIESICSEVHLLTHFLEPNEITDVTALGQGCWVHLRRGPETLPHTSGKSSTELVLYGPVVMYQGDWFWGKENAQLSQEFLDNV